MHIRTFNLVRFGSAKALTRESVGQAFPELSQPGTYDIA